MKLYQAVIKILCHSDHPKAFSFCEQTLGCCWLLCCPQACGNSSWHDLYFLNIFWYCDYLCFNWIFYALYVEPKDYTLKGFCGVTKYYIFYGTGKEIVSEIARFSAHHARFNRLTCKINSKTMRKMKTWFQSLKSVSIHLCFSFDLTPFLC